MTAEEILVIILAGALAVFLVLAIILISYLILLAKKLNRVADMAEKTVDHVESLVSNVKRAAAPVAIGNFLVDAINRFTDRKRK